MPLAILSKPSNASDKALGTMTKPPFSFTLSDTKLMARSCRAESSSL